MKNGRNHRFICLLLAVTIMISGICLDKIPANSFFSCKKTGAITIPNRQMKSVSAYKTEKLNQQEVLSSIHQIKKDSGPNTNSVQSVRAGNLLKLDGLAQDCRTYISAKENRLYYETLCSITILEYIHRQDGEKVEPSFRL